jgi:hypothetical protein
MRIALLCFVALATCVAAHAEGWRVDRIDAPARVTAIETMNGQVRVMAGGLWYALKRDDGKVSLDFIDTPPPAKLPQGALPDGQVATGQHDIARAWLAEPTDRYDHGILGDKIEAGALVIEPRDGKRHTVRLKPDAVFEDLAPRLADLDRDGHDEIVVVKSYLKRGSSLAVIGERRGRYEIIAETPPLGQPHRWLDPAGIADFNGDRKTDIALVRQPHRRHARDRNERGGRFRRRRYCRYRDTLARPQPLAHCQLCTAGARDRQRAAAGQGRQQSRPGRGKR